MTIDPRSASDSEQASDGVGTSRTLYAVPTSRPSRRSWPSLALRRSVLRHAALACALLMAVLVFADRYAWASVAQWREDAGTNLWLGYELLTQGKLPTIGLISSVGLPNPNGVPLLCALLGMLPSLLWVSIVCGVLQALSIVWASRELAFGSRLAFWQIAAPCLSCVYLRAASVELWNQWLFVTVNALYVALVARELRVHHVLHHVGIGFLILLSPTLYLAGVLNSLVFSAGWLVLCIHRNRAFRWRELMLGGMAVTWLGLAYLALTWLPYARLLFWHSLAQRAKAPLLERLGHGLVALFTTPQWLLNTHPIDLDPIWHSSATINGAKVAKLVTYAHYIFVAQLCLSAVALCFALLRAYDQRRAPKRSAPLWILGLVVLAYVLSPIIGGFPWHEGDRSDQQIEFLGLVMWFAFGPALWGQELGRVWRPLSRMTSGLALLYTVVAAASGFLIVGKHREYRGRTLSMADVPLVHKEQALAFIADDWRKHSTSARIPIFYEMPGHWEWVPSFGEQLLSYDMEPVFTTGRALDWELSRRYGLQNVHEGEQKRRWRSDRYVMSYAARRIPAYLRDTNAKHIVFGRVRVSIYEPKR